MSFEVPVNVKRVMFIFVRVKWRLKVNYLHLFSAMIEKIILRVSSLLEIDVNLRGVRLLIF